MPLRRSKLSPPPPFRGEREGPAPKAREGEVGVGERTGIPHLTPALSAPEGRRGGVLCRLGNHFNNSTIGWRSRGMRAVAEGEQQAGHVVIVFGRRRGPAGDPVEQVG